MHSNPRIAKLFKRVSLQAVVRMLLVLLLPAFLLVSNGWSAPVDLATAHLVAQNTVRHHLALHGHWNGSTAPTVGPGEEVQYQGCTVAYDFNVSPSGHVLVSVDDTLSPVPLYSTRSAFVAARAGQPQSLESWIVPEQHAKVAGLEQVRTRAAGFQTSASFYPARIARAWEIYLQPAQDGSSQASLTASVTQRSAVSRSATVAPLLTTLWGQSSPYYLMTPSVNGAHGCTHTLTGCVATAWAQVLNYWQWPAQGQGSVSYSWNGRTLSMDFSQSVYDWSHMGDTPSGTDTVENQAISKLLYDVALAAQTVFGCTESTSQMWADDVLDVYFGYKAMTFHDRLDYSDPDAWFAMFQTELDATPPRPVIFSIFSDTIGHEVVVDGYQTDTTNMVHINFGWPTLADAYEGYFDISDPSTFYLQYYWDVNEQYLVTGIQPNENATLPTVNAGADQSVDEGAAVTLSGSAVHDGYTIETLQWRKVDDPEFQITGSNQSTATFTAPSVSADTTMVFRFKAIDNSGNVGFDDCTVTVRNTDAPPATPPATPTPVPFAGDGGGGGGGCFIATLR
ncbi:MAG: C10 family peptidase [Desulfobacteraceae bacterium]|nr:C10 family peptidase [Desulfobacteraceae bacterium]